MSQSTPQIFWNATNQWQVYTTASQAVLHSGDNERQWVTAALFLWPTLPHLKLHQKQTDLWKSTDPRTAIAKTSEEMTLAMALNLYLIIHLSLAGKQEVIIFSVSYESFIISLQLFQRFNPWLWLCMSSQSWDTRCTGVTLKSSNRIFSVIEVCYHLFLLVNICTPKCKGIFCGKLSEQWSLIKQGKRTLEALLVVRIC